MAVVAARRKLPVLALLAVTFTSGCSETRDCTLVGAEPGVRVAGGADGASVRICEGATCGTAVIRNGGAFVSLPTLRPGRQAELEATYSSASRSRTSLVKVVPDKFQPNGPGCDPSVAAATVTFDREGRAAG